MYSSSSSTCSSTRYMYSSSRILVVRVVVPGTCVHVVNSLLLHRGRCCAGACTTSGSIMPATVIDARMAEDGPKDRNRLNRRRSWAAAVIASANKSSSRKALRERLQRADTRRTLIAENAKFSRTVLQEFARLHRPTYTLFDAVWFGSFVFCFGASLCLSIPHLLAAPTTSSPPLPHAVFPVSSTFSHILLPPPLPTCVVLCRIVSSLVVLALSPVAICLHPSSLITVLGTTIRFVLVA